MISFSGILDIGQAEDLQMMNEKLIDEKELQVGLQVNQLE